VTTEESVKYLSVPGFPGYRVGDDGSVWTAWKKGPGGKGSGRGTGKPYISDEWKRIRVKLRPGDYPMVGLKRVGCKAVVWPLHRVVMLAFVGPRPKGNVCRHLDGNPHNNSLSNLCYGTPQENVEDSVRHGTFVRGEKSPSAKLTNDSVRSIRIESAAGATLDALAAKYKVDRNAIWLAVKRKTWKHVE